MIELLVVEVDVEVLTDSIVESLVISLAIELLAIEVNAKIFVVASLANRSRLTLTLMIKSFTAVDDELNSCKRSNN